MANEDQDFTGSLCGCDEVGRGPLAGPVVAAAVYVEDPSAYRSLASLGAGDSKKLTKKIRNQICETLGVKHLQFAKAVSPCTGVRVAVVRVEPKVIDEINILQASLLAMKKATLLVCQRVDRLLIDGNKKFEFERAKEVQSWIKGDSRSLLIGLASIIAKEQRDALMDEYHQKFPVYGFNSHSGYPTRQHKEAISEFGIIPIHRKSFKGVKEFVQ